MTSITRIIADFFFFGKGYLRNRIGLFFSLIFPVILILIFGAIFSGGFGSSNSTSGPVTVYVQNLDSGQLGPQFIAAVNSTTLPSSYTGAGNGQLFDISLCSFVF